jgi:photosystem II stability/assembly factor-like uncharacterized protein
MKINAHNTALASVCLAIVLLTMVSLLCPAQLPGHAQSNQYPARTPAPVSTFTPAELSFIHMLDANTGWAVSETSSLQNDTLLVTPRVFHTPDSGELWAVDAPAEINPSTNDSSAVWLAWVEVTPETQPSQEHASYFFLNESSAWFALTDGNQGISVYRTENEGKAWKRSELKIKQDNGVPIPRDICFIDARHGWIMIGYGVAMGSERDKIYRRVDGGMNWTLAAATGGWQQIKPGNFPLMGVKNGLCFRDDQNGFLAGDARGDVTWFYATHDAGATWALQLVPVYNNKGVGVETQTPVFFNTSDGILPITFHNDDGSQEAFARGPGSPWQSIAFQTKSIHPMIFFRTADGGQTWQASTPVSPAADNYLSWSIVDMENIVATDGSTIYQTDDGARTWATMAPGQTLKELLRSGGQITSLDFVTGETGWALLSSADNQATQLIRTTDGGQSWGMVWDMVHLMEKFK